MGEILFWAGISGAGITLIVSIAVIIIFTVKRKRLYKELTEKYGTDGISDTEK